MNDLAQSSSTSMQVSSIGLMVPGSQLRMNGSRDYEWRTRMNGNYGSRFSAENETKTNTVPLSVRKKKDSNLISHAIDGV